MGLRTFVRQLLGRDAQTGSETAEDSQSADGGIAADAAGNTDAAGSADAASSADPASDGPSPAEATDVSDEDRVLRLLIDGDGQVTVAALRERTGWSERRVDRVLAEMEDDGQVRLLSRGAETLVCRPGFEPGGNAPLFDS